MGHYLKRFKVAANAYVGLGLVATLGCGTGPEALDETEAFATTQQELSYEAPSQLPNNFPLLNAHGLSASYSTQGAVSLSNEFHTPQGTNGRSCVTCHAVQDSWSLRPQTAQYFFDSTDGTHPLFNIIDANTPVSDVSTVEARRQSYSMLLQGKFLRLRSPPAVRQYNVIAAEDPFNYGTTARLLFFRRPLATANFKSTTVMWDAANTVAGDLHAGLVRQARGNVTGAQQGPPATDAVITAIVDYEKSISQAQLVSWGAGLLNAAGANGGPEAHASQPLVAGRFDLYDAWIGSRNPFRARIARGQELFNNGDHNGRSCGGCHSAANSGQNVNAVLFDIGASKPQFKKADMAVYTFQNTTTGEIRQSTDPGRAIVTGNWADMDRFKVPSLRGLTTRAPYFHNGIADSLEDVVKFYEQSLGFDFTDEEEKDLVAFMNAL